MAEISYKPVEPLFGKDFQDRFGSWLYNKFFASEDWGAQLGYPGQLSPDLAQTRLPDVYKSWQPWTGGASYIADYMANNRGGIGTQDPRLQSMMQYGGTGGPGNNAMSLMMQYGAPSQAGQPMSNMAQFGASSAPLAQRLADFASGAPTGAAQYLMPFLTAPTYKAPGVSNALNFVNVPRRA